MSREIKFRAWNKKSKFMDSAWLLDFEHELVGHSKHNQSDMNDCELMQYTGSKDVKGNEVYEGDICTVWMGVKQDNPYVVKDLREFYLDMNHADSYYRITRIEVIGNIYENPELLEPNK